MSRIIIPYKRKAGSKKQQKELKELNDLKNRLIEIYYSKL